LPQDRLIFRAIHLDGERPDQPGTIAGHLIENLLSLIVRHVLASGKGQALARITINILWPLRFCSRLLTFRRLLLGRTPDGYEQYGHCQSTYDSYRLAQQLLIEHLNLSLKL